MNYDFTTTDEARSAIAGMNVDAEEAANLLLEASIEERDKGYIKPSEVERHNAYSWVKPDATACVLCGKKTFNTPVEGFQVIECFHCAREICEDCADIEGGGGDDGSQLSGWNCTGEARAECERIARDIEADDEAIARLRGLQLAAPNAFASMVLSNAVKHLLEAA